VRVPDTSHSLSGLDQFESEFAAKGVNARQLDLNGISKPEGSTMPAAFDDMFAFVVVVGVVEEEVEVHQTFHEIDLKLHKKADHTGGRAEVRLLYLDCMDCLLEASPVSSVSELLFRIMSGGQF